MDPGKAWKNCVYRIIQHKSRIIENTATHKSLNAKLPMFDKGLPGLEPRNLTSDFVGCMGAYRVLVAGIWVMARLSFAIPKMMKMIAKASALRKNFFGLGEAHRVHCLLSIV